jgi:ribosomal protein S18 acetylase RimI-like enzyme
MKGVSTLIELLRRGEWPRLRTIRLRALAESPEAFVTTVREAEGWSPESWESQIEKFATFIWREGETDLGIVRGAAHDGDPEAGYLISMWVAPEARRRGIGAALVNEVIVWARHQGLRRLVLDVGEDNVPAQKLYQSQGFVATGATAALPPPREQMREIGMQIEL